MAKETSHPAVAVFSHPFKAGKRVIALNLTKLTADEKAYLKDLRGPENSGYFTWSGALGAYTAVHDDDLELAAIQFAMAYTHIRKEGLVEVEAPAAKVDKAAQRRDRNSEAADKFTSFLKGLTKDLPKPETA